MSLPAFCAASIRIFDEIRRADVTARLQMRDGVELRLGVAGASWDHGAAERVRASFEDVGAGRQVIRKRIVHDVA